MTTRLEGDNTFFLPFNKGTKEGGASNEVPENQNEYATAYLWREVLAPDNILRILARFVHLQIEEKEDWQGKKYKKETLIFPRYHQWDVVTQLVADACENDPGYKYLIQHSAGSGKSNSIAWTAHQLKEVLMLEPDEEQGELTSEDLLDATLEARKGNQNLSFFAFTATLKPKIPDAGGQQIPDRFRPAQTLRHVRGQETGRCRVRTDSVAVESELPRKS